MGKLSYLIKIGIMLLVLTSCQREIVPPDKTEDDENITISRPDSLGYMMLDSTEYTIVKSYYSEENGRLDFVFSPDTTQTLSTYLYLSIKKDLVGMEIDVTRYYHNDDYYFNYEDPFVLYSRYWSLKGGTIKIAKSTSDADYFTIEVDVLLPDGKPFKMKYAGKIPAYSFYGRGTPTRTEDPLLPKQVR